MDSAAVWATMTGSSVMSAGAGTLAANGRAAGAPSGAVAAPETVPTNSDAGVPATTHATRSTVSEPVATATLAVPGPVPATTTDNAHVPSGHCSVKCTPSPAT